MTIIDLKNGYFKLTSPNGVKDIRTQNVYTEVVVKEKHIKYFVEA